MRHARERHSFPGIVSRPCDLRGAMRRPRCAVVSDNGCFPYTEITSRWSAGFHEEAMVGLLDAMPAPLRMRPDELGGPPN